MENNEPIDALPERSTSHGRPLLTLDFKGEASIRKERQFRKAIDHEFIPELNSNAAVIAETIREEIERNLPAEVKLVVDIQFTSGSIAWSGIVGLIETAGTIIDGVDIARLAIKAVRFSVNKVLRNQIQPRFPIKNIETKVSERKVDPIHPITRLLWWCSGAVIGILRESPTEKSKYVGVGGAVLSTWVLATASGGYAMYTMLEGWRVKVGIAIAFGLLWGLVIFNLDRYIVSTMRKTRESSRIKAFMKELGPASPRLLLAIILGITISKPLELTLFRAEIDNQIELNKEQLVKARGDEFDNLNQSRIIVRQNALNNINAEIESKRKYTADMQTTFLEETDGSGGSRRYGYSMVARIKEKQYKAADQDYKKTEAAYAIEKQKLESELKSIEKEKSEILDNYRASLGAGLLARNKALSDLAKKEDSIWYASLAIVLLIILVEIAPVLVKLLSSYGPYDAKLNLRNESEIKEAEYQKDSKDEIARHYYECVTAAEKKVDKVFFDKSVSVRTRKIQTAWDMFGGAFHNTPSSSVRELVEFMKDSFYINRNNGRP